MGVAANLVPANFINDLRRAASLHFQGGGEKMGHRKKKKGDKDRVKQIRYMGVGVCVSSISIYPLQTCPSGSDSEQEEIEKMEISKVEQ